MGRLVHTRTSYSAIRVYKYPANLTATCNCVSGYSRTHHTFHALSSGRHPRNHVHDSLTASPPLSCFADSVVYFRYLIVHCSIQALVFPHILIKPPQHLPMPLQTTKDHTNQTTSTLPSEQKPIPVTMAESPMILLGEDD